MKATAPSPRLLRQSICLTLLLALSPQVFPGPATLATEPFTLSGRVSALPNVMFVLDDSGSMNRNYLPDWAGPRMAADNVTVLMPAHRFFNGAFNGVAYNPAIRYKPPVYYSATGERDTTTYPNMDGTSAATGGDATATAMAPNWRDVKVDGYGVQSAVKVNLEGGAFSYTTVPGEYCTSNQLRTCTASATPTGSYTFPAKLRWCTTSAEAADTTAGAGTACQAANIDNSAANQAAGVQHYTYARMPSPRTATITVTSSASISGVTVGGLEILSAATGAGATAADVAAVLAQNINACTYGPTGACATVGYSAAVTSATVTVYAPGVTTATPAIGSGSATVTAFAANNVPGASLLTVITPSITSYPFPGSAAKDPNRSDCAGTTCTYAEEMTNYANWYAYYRTRMQMMKTSASIAFSTVDDGYRVGYYSINNGLNGTGTEFINPKAFDGIQKRAWYTKFLNAVPYGPTPLRTGLATMGQFYSGQLGTINNVTATDPMQYSCQQNFTILSTDGYWNDAANPKMIDRVTDVGQQDHNDPRPYYDGALQTKTTSTTWGNDEQFALTTRLYEQRTRTQRVTSRQLTRSEVTTTTYPYQQVDTPLRKRVKQLNQNVYKLEKRTYPLIDTTRQLQKNETFIQKTTRPLERYTYNPVETTTPLRKTVTNITVTTYPLQSKTESPQARITQLQVGTQVPQKRTQHLQIKTQAVERKILALQKKTETINSTTSPLLRAETLIKATTYQLQAKDNISTDGGDSWFDTAWYNVSSCTVTPGVVETNVRNRRCQYAAGVESLNQTSCAVVAKSAGPTNYTVGLARDCVYQAAPAPVAAASCTVRTQSATFAHTQVACSYGTAGAPVTGLHSCSANDQTSQLATNGATITGNKVVCGYDAASWVAATACNPSAPANYGGDRITCQFVDPGSWTIVPSCTPNAQASAPYTADRTQCQYASASWVDATPDGSETCTPVTPSPDYSASKVTCQYSGTWSGWSNATLPTGCTVRNQANTGAMSGDRVDCQWGSVSWADATPAGSETCSPTNPANYTTANKISCRYNGTGSWGNVGSCTARDQTSQLGTIGATISGDKVECQYESGTYANAGTCTPVTPSPAYSGSKTSCQYRTTPSSTLANQTACTPRDQPTTAAMSGDKVVCAWDATGTTTTTSPCTWNVPATATTPKTTCAYDVAFNTTASPASCTPVPQANSNTANGQVWSGNIVTCGWAAAVVATLDPVTGSCTPTGSSAGPPYSAYTTCGWGTGVVATNQTSCTKRNAVGGPFTNGAFVACAYQATPTTTDVTSGDCTTRAQDTTNFTVTGVTCSYATATTPTVTNCTDQPMSSGPVYTVLNSHSCAYSTTASATDTNATTCDANRQTTSPFTGPAVDCTYSASATTTSNVASCTWKDAQTGPNYTGGGRVTCGYDASWQAWANVNAPSTCTWNNPTATPGTTGTVYASGVECAYNGTATTNPFDNTCAAIPGQSGTADGTLYSTRTQRVCNPGTFPSVGAAVVTDPVDSCNTTDVPGTLPNGVTTNKVTTCTYNPASTTTATGAALPCVDVPASAGPAYVTSKVCSVIDTGWGPVTTAPLTTSCVTSGTPEPASPIVFDNTTGMIVECRNSDTTPYNATYPSGYVPVASCTVGTADNLTTGVRTVCVKPAATPALPNINLAAVPVNPATCVNTTAPVAPDYIWTRCNPVTSSATVRGCLPQSPTAPLWQTITCAATGGGTENTLADVAMYYYKTDLRTPALNNCIGAVVPPAATGTTLCTNTKPMNNVPTSSRDPASWQHMTTFTLGLGASGYMQYSPTYETDATGDFATVKGVAPFLPDNGINADPTNGICTWQTSNLCNWPRPESNEQTTIDDLWHAGVNGRGAYFSATDPTSLSDSISGALAGVAAAGGAGASPTVSNPSLTPGDSYIFSSTYTTMDWTGELVRRLIDPITGAISASPDWAVKGKLDAKPWADRNIWTFDASVATTKLKAFTAANFATNSIFLAPHVATGVSGLTQFMCGIPEICLSAASQTAATGTNLVNFLRGDRSYEGVDADNTKYYRQRQAVLGDIVNAQVVYVNRPVFNYADYGYDQFQSAQTGRASIVYAGANDGMLHAFYGRGLDATENAINAAALAKHAADLDPGNAALATLAASTAATALSAVASDTQIGQELWAYIPTMVMPNLYKLADKKYRDKHRYFVDGTPVVGDVCISDCADPTAAWRTILVGGLGRGGRGYYALDVTTPASPKALWEFTNANLGYTFGEPAIAKLKDGTWVVLLSSGYNNIPNEDGNTGDGIGRIFVLDAYTGTLIRTISTGYGSADDPSGLSKIVAQVINPMSDATIEAVYGGDLYGNVWRFDVNDDIGASGYDAQLLAVLKDGAGNRQPITGRPQVSKVPSTSDVIVFVGTGRYLATTDADNVLTQSFYGIVDPRTPATDPAVAIHDNPGGSPRVEGVSARGFMRQIQTEEVCPAGALESICRTGEVVRTSTNNAVEYASHYGWFVDLIGEGERANTDPALALGELVFTTNKPSLEACEIGGSSFIYFLNYLTGGPVGGDLAFGSVRRVVGRGLATQIASSPTLSVTREGKLVSIVGLSGGGIEVVQPPMPPGASTTRRTSWRELIRE